ncbi:N-terminal domain of NEFA-interacting nuclear protein NIP30-domain-containing protein [Roridomyces roridus]|uniref:N-terminal domain of NEFA-interacting nuclear protein NIP30-domain-containing protein n=1 Tax=Roridomyces roridus TaxID=1738132 RepID=A0AAD7BUW8_9AGAR|nr:N-terminal domain of NEFA-interacting nuclear protein NIP30-domain-containing protein [Roridomyces roridus]
MEVPEVPSLSSAGIGSRFVTQDDVESARTRRDEQWKAAYARLGMEPPPQQQEDFSDGRSLAEKLAANKIAKQEEYEERTKLANQFRALEEDEVMFLDSVRERQEEEERQRKEKDGVEVQGFKECATPFLQRTLFISPQGGRRA